MATVVPAEGVILKRVLEAAPDLSLDGLSREAYAKFDAAQTKTAWGCHHRRRSALVDGADVLASATQYDLAAVFEHQPVRVCGIGAMLTPPAHRTRADAKELVERLLDEAPRNGATMPYVVVSVVGLTWTIEECGDRDPTGARVGAILQALIAREPVERRPTIRAWLPRGFVPPQVTIVSAKPSPEVLMVRSLGAQTAQPRLSAGDVLYWRSDIF